MKIRIKYIAVLLSAMLAGCAHPTVTQAVKPGDTGLSCAEMQNEYADADKLKAEADGEKGVTGGNVARLLFWPSIIGTYMNANEAIAAADNRKVHLANLMSQKGCQVPENLAHEDSKAAATAPAQTTTDDKNSTAISSNDIPKKLEDLKTLKDSGAITQDDYDKKKQELLEKM